MTHLSERLKISGHSKTRENAIFSSPPVRPMVKRHRPAKCKRRVRRPTLKYPPSVPPVYVECTYLRTYSNDDRVNQGRVLVLKVLALLKVQCGEFVSFSRLQFIKLQLRTFLKVNELIRLTIKIEIAKQFASTIRIKTHQSEISHTYARREGSTRKSLVNFKNPLL